MTYSVSQLGPGLRRGTRLIWCGVANTISLFLATTPALAQRAEVPIRLVVLSDGVRRYAVTLQVDSRPVEANLDTGSTGLRILAASLPEAVSAKGSSTHYGYGSGVEFTGKAVGAALGIGTLSAPRVTIERIDGVACRDRTPDCPAKRAGAYRIAGDGLPNEGFAAIIGIGLRADAVPNPLVALGVHRWIVDLPREGVETAGRLVLNPDAAEIAHYRQFGFIGDTNQVAGCIAAADGSAKVCAPTMVDSGASGLRVQGGTPQQVLPQGTAAVLAIGDGRETATMPVTIGRRDQASAMRLYPARQSGQLSLSFGIAPYLHWSVLYDADARRIGVADRP